MFIYYLVEMVVVMFFSFLLFFNFLKFDTGSHVTWDLNLFYSQSWP